ncbi:MAG: AAC(3)-I family aminoglycoside N-acetyltransferase [Hyphomonadaceae bacterium]
MAVTVHRLAAGDVAQCRALNAMFGKAFDDADAYRGKPPGDAYLETLLAKPHIIPLVALREGQVIGGLVAYELDKFEQERSEVCIYDLAVDEAHRRQGVATALIGRLREIASSRKAWVIYVQADYGDEPAIALYTKLGVREDVMHFDIDPEKR